MKSIVMLVVGLVGCSDSFTPSPVDPGTEYVGSPSDNSGVVCVVGEQSWPCNVNTWSWNNDTKSCSGFGKCMDGMSCKLSWNGQEGVCMGVDGGR